MKRSEFSEWCRAGVRLLDGATGTNLMRAGMPRGVCTEQWVLEHPQTILKLQREYAAAGSEVLYAPTFCANRCALKGYGLEERLHTMNVSLVQLTRKAAGAGVLVAGDMTTLGRPVEEDGAHSYQALLRVYREQAEALLDGGVDLFAVETMMGVTESMAAASATCRSSARSRFSPTGRHTSTETPPRRRPLWRSLARMRSASTAPPGRISWKAWCG